MVGRTSLGVLVGGTSVDCRATSRLSDVVLVFLHQGFGDFNDVDHEPFDHVLVKVFSQDHAKDFFILYIRRELVVGNDPVALPQAVLNRTLLDTREFILEARGELEGDDRQRWDIVVYLSIWRGRDGANRASVRGDPDAEFRSLG